LNTSTSTSDEALLQLLGQRLAQLRLAKNLTQGQVAEQAGVGLRTVQRLELGASAMQLSGFLRVCRVLGLVERLDLLIPEAVASPMTLLKQAGRKRRRASGNKAAPSLTGQSTWGEQA
jgi:transcriptional regulator with XRE-family HTH domain